MIKNIIILLGLPGSGKGTQGEIIAKALNIPHISTGNILRKVAREKTEDAKLLNQYMTKGKLVPDNLINHIIVKHITFLNGCVLDGYPRNLGQAKYFLEKINANISTIFFNISDGIAIKRILGRITCNSCNKIYNRHVDLPKKDGICDQCGSNQIIVRSDDEQNIILSRLTEYKNNTLPMIAYYKTKGKFFTVNGERLIEQVSEEVISIIKKI